MTVRAEGSFQIINVLGLHARAAAKLVHLASQFESRITIARDGHVVDAKSVMGVLLLCGYAGSVVDFVAVGADASEAIEAIGALIANRFGEER